MFPIVIAKDFKKVIGVLGFVSNRIEERRRLLVQSTGSFYNSNCNSRTKANRNQTRMNDRLYYVCSFLVRDVMFQNLSFRVLEKRELPLAEKLFCAYCLLPETNNGTMYSSI
jgi:hypothetical protein